MNMAEEVDILRQLLQRAGAAIGPVAGHHELAIRQPTGHSFQHFHGPFGTSPVDPWSVAGEAKAKRQTEDFGRRPMGKSDHSTQPPCRVPNW